MSKKKNKKTILQCPKCGSESISQYETDAGPIWCDNCFHTNKHKEQVNEFMAVDEPADT